MATEQTTPTVPQGSEALVFVYNADAGWFNMVTDIAHKIFSPATYPCSLCDLTYGVFKIRPEWDAFVRSTPLPLVFLHRDEFIEQYPALQHTPLPVVLRQAPDGSCTTLLDAPTLDGLQTIGELKTRLSVAFTEK
jgi:hypothetical protein